MQQARPVDASGLVSYAALCQIRDSITEGPTQEILFMAFLMATAPRVLDLHACMNFEKEPNQPQLRHHTGTYLVLPKSGSNKACVVYRSITLPGYHCLQVTLPGYHCLQV